MHGRPLREPFIPGCQCRTDCPPILVFEAKIQIANGTSNADRAYVVKTPGLSHRPRAQAIAIGNAAGDPDQRLGARSVLTDTARKATFGGERRQSARKQTFRRSSANVRLVPFPDIGV